MVSALSHCQLVSGLCLISPLLAISPAMKKNRISNSGLLFLLLIVNTFIPLFRTNSVHSNASVWGPSL